MHVGPNLRFSPHNARATSMTPQQRLAWAAEHAPLELLQLLATLNVGGASLGYDASSGPSPTHVARGAVLGERGRLQQEKHTFTAKEREQIAKHIKPPADARRITAEVDAILHDPRVPAKDKKKHIDEVRKRHDIPGNVMHQLFTGRLGRLTNESKARLDKQHGALKKNLGEQLARAKKLFGNESPQALAIQAQLDGVERVMKPEVKRLHTQASQLDGMFKPRRKRRGLFRRIGNFFKKIGRGIKNGFKKIGRGIKKAFKAVGRFFKKIGKYLLMGLDLLVAGLSFIPGIGQFVGLAYNGIRSIVDFARGNWKGGLKRLAGVLPGVGGALGLAGAIGGKVGEVVGKVVDVAKKGAGYVKGAVNAIRSGIRKDWGGLAQGLLGIAGSAAGASGTDAGARAAEALGHVGKAVPVVDRAARGDYLGALGAASSFAGGFDGERAARASEVLGHVGAGAHVIDRAARGDALGAAAGVSNALAPTPVGDALRDVGLNVADGIGLDAEKRARMQQVIRDGTLAASLLRP